MSPQNSPEVGDTIGVRRGKVDSVDLYEVKENELELLGEGSPASLQLNFAIFLISSAFSSVLTLTTATVKNQLVQTAYVVVAVVGTLLGLYLLLSWWRTQSSIKKLIATIRGRIPPPACPPTPGGPTNNAQGGDQAPAG